MEFSVLVFKLLTAMYGCDSFILWKINDVINVTNNF